jgi:hypothetical protein
VKTFVRIPTPCVCNKDKRLREGSAEMSAPKEMSEADIRHVLLTVFGQALKDQSLAKELDLKLVEGSGKNVQSSASIQFSSPNLMEDCPKNDLAYYETVWKRGGSTPEAITDRYLYLQNVALIAIFDMWFVNVVCTLACEHEMMMELLKKKVRPENMTRAQENEWIHKEILPGYVHGKLVIEVLEVPTGSLFSKPAESFRFIQRLIMVDPAVMEVDGMKVTCTKESFVVVPHFIAIMDVWMEMVRVTKQYIKLKSLLMDRYSTHAMDKNFKSRTDLRLQDVKMFCRDTLAMLVYDHAFLDRKRYMVLNKEQRAKLPNPSHYMSIKGKRMMDIVCIVCTKQTQLVCNQCHLALYCSRDCQRVHWKAHKPTCKEWAIHPLEKLPDLMLWETLKSFPGIMEERGDSMGFKTFRDPLTDNPV